MLREFDTENNDQFIRGWFIDENVCDNLVSYFENNEEKHPGLVNTKQGLVVNHDYKKSTDISISTYCQDEPFIAYMQELGLAVVEYKKLFPSLNKLSMWGIKENVNIQKYLPNEGFFVWHSERSSLHVSERLLVFTTYLNDVVDEGETEWLHQNLKIKPQKGLTVISPVDWMYEHRGITSPTETKYIATGWMSYV